MKIIRKVCAMKKNRRKYDNIKFDKEDKITLYVQ